MKSLKTQTDVEKRINYYIQRELGAERKRDQEEWESPQYWYWHDIAVQWRERAVRLMPKGS